MLSYKAKILETLQSYLGEYVHGLSHEALKVSIWQGNVVLNDLELRADALNALKLPVIVKAGHLGCLTIKVPWSRLGRESVVVLLDRVYILAEVIHDAKLSKATENENLFDAKRRELEEAESAVLEAKERKSSKTENSAEAKSWLNNTITTIIGNLKISITNVHVRYEDKTSIPGKPICAGITLSKLAAVTIDENLKETFLPSGVLDKLHKSLHLEGFAIYHDSGRPPWNMEKTLKELTSKEWNEVFEPAINQNSGDNSLSGELIEEHQYLLRPINGVLNYHRCSKREKRDPAVPFQNISLVLNEVSINISEAQYCDGLRLLEVVSQYKKRVKFSHLRPGVAVSENPRAWWIYASQAALRQQEKTPSYLSWEIVKHMCSLRRTYVQLYADSLLRTSITESKQLREIEDKVDLQVLLLWRLLARAKAESLKSKESSLESDKVKKRGWWGFGWKTVAGNDFNGSPLEDNLEKQDIRSGDFTKEEWERINELLNYHPGEDPLVQEDAEALQISVDAIIKESAVRIFDQNRVEILGGSFMALCVGLNMYMKTSECHIKLHSYGISAPEGSLMKSVSNDDNKQVLSACFIYQPFRSTLDWKLSATILPCYVMVCYASFERIRHFFNSSHAVNRDIALETAAALQSKFEKVRRAAKKRLKSALKEERRFSIDLDLDAPKVRLLADTRLTNGLNTELILDLGHFTLHTGNDEKHEHANSGHHLKGNLYSQCYISGVDIAAYLVDGSFDWVEMSSSLSMDTGSHETMHNVLPVLDRCGMFILLEQLRIPHPAYPLMHVGLQVPQLGLHFSARRYERLLQLIATFDGSKDQLEKAQSNALWYPADHEDVVRVLFWKGIGNAVAEWQPRCVVLNGSYLYVLESVNSQTYQRCFSLDGKQVLEVPPSYIGGSPYVLAVCSRGIELQKGLETSSSFIMELTDQGSKETWLKLLTSTIQKLSILLSSSLPEYFIDEDEELDPPRVDLLSQPLFFITGTLNELQLSICGATDTTLHGLNSEAVILSLQAGGGKVNVLQRQYDLTVGMNLHYLKIEDKLRGSISPSCQYVARSVLSKENMCLTIVSNDALTESELKMREEEDIYNDALNEFGGSPSSSPAKSLDYSQSYSKRTEKVIFSSVKNMVLSSELEPFNLHPGERLMDKILTGTNRDSRSFVTMQIITRQSESPDYDGTDVQMTISMATLEFFCNRPTVVALIDFGSEISEILDRQSNVPDNSKESDVLTNDVRPLVECEVVRGLLGQGKSRIVFQLKMNMDSLCIFLNLEDGTGLAMLDQERFHMDLKVFPGSFAIHGLLGNLRVCDMILGQGHHWGWACDIRDPGCDSLVKLIFQSFNVDEDDYEGYDYSLEGRLSSVRIVFLYRFIQEVMVYFSALSAPHAQHLTRVVDKVGGMEKFVPQSDIEGLPALKLNVSLDNPIIKMPKSSSSKEYMQLDLGFLNVTNKFEWHGGSKEDASSIHLDVLSAEISGINMIVGMDGQEGKPMIQDVRGLTVRIRRPLRDLFRMVPEVQVDIQVGTLRGILSDKEYLLVTGCATSNIAEMAHLPPDFRAVPPELVYPTDVNTEIPMNSEIQKPSLQSGSSGEVTVPWTTFRVTIEVQTAELELHNGLERESALARVQLQDLWVNYRNNSLQEIDILLSLSRLRILDLRVGSKPEMRLMLGSMADLETNIISSKLEENGDKITTLVEPQAPMMVLDTKIKEGFQALIIRIQRPRLLVVLDFLLAVGEFFLPSLAKLTGKDDCNDPIIDNDHIRLVEPYYKQKDPVMTLSSQRKLIVDFPNFHEFTYDGCGNTLCIQRENLAQDGSDSVVIDPVILIGAGKKLFFKNVKIKNGLILKDCIQLLSYSSYSVRVEDGVILDGTYEQDCDYLYDKSVLEPNSNPKLRSQVSCSTGSNFTLNVQAIASELTFYDSDYANLHQREKLIRVKMDLNLIYAWKERDLWIRGHAKRFSIDCGSGLCVIEPMVASLEYACVKDKTSISISASDVSVQLSFSLMRLLLHVHSNVVSTFQFGGAHVLSRCSHFERIWVNTEHISGQRFTIWRPRPPPGYVILSDSITSGEAPPSQAVMAMNNIFHRVKKPLDYHLVWTLNDSTKQCSVWRPIAPPGYVSLGCIAKIGSVAPPLNAVYCVRLDLVTSASISDCVLLSHPKQGFAKEFSIWRIDNAVGSFIAHQSHKPPEDLLLFDLRNVLYEDGSDSNVQFNRLSDRNSRKLDRKWTLSGVHNLEIPQKSGHLISTTAQFERMWWDKGGDNRRPISIWRPIPPPGYVIVGDHLVEGLEPPNLGIVLQDDNSGRFAAPTGFVLMMHTPGKGLEELYVWYPSAPPGYVTMGCVVTKDEDIDITIFRCVRADLVFEVGISRKPAWSMSGTKSGYSCSLWKVQNQVKTFLARPDLKKPPACTGYGLVETVQSIIANKNSGDIKIPKVSVTVLDDLRGLVTPLANITVTNINLAASGHAEALSGACIAYIAASTFNAQVKAWEPLIEPFKGIFKHESHDSPSGPSSKTSITTVNIVNIDATYANINTFVDSVISWKRQSELDMKTLTKMNVDDERTPKTDVSPALEEDDKVKLLLLNKLDCNLFIRTFEHDFADCLILEHDKVLQIHMPPPNFGENFVPGGSKLLFQHVAIYVSEAKDLPINEDGNGQEYFYSLHVPPSKNNEGQKKFSQSARSRCVGPSFPRPTGDRHVATALWNEVFIFDLQPEGDARMDIRVHNMAANSGRGEVIGFVSFPLGIESNVETKPPSSHSNRIWQSLSHLHHVNRPVEQKKMCCVTVPIRKENGTSADAGHGSLVVTICYYIEKAHQPEEETDMNRNQFKDIGFLIGLSPSGPWTHVRSVLPLGKTPIKLANGHVALEVHLSDGQKRATLRSLVSIINQTDAAVEICVCPLSLVSVQHGTSAIVDDEPIVIVEEIFENQRYQILVGWGSKWPGHFLPTDPRRWSTRDTQTSSQSREDIEPPLPSGWIWITDWTVDKAGYVDDDGWAYGPDFQTLRWPPNSLRSCKKSPFDFIRRRRWCRSRQQLIQSENVKFQPTQSVSIIEPGENIPISLTSLLSEREYCLQVRPWLQTAAKYLWGRSIRDVDNREYSISDSPLSRRTSHVARNSMSSFVVNTLQKTEELVMCTTENLTTRTAWWFSIESDSDILYNEMSLPVHDWKILVSAPLKLENLLPYNAEYTIWEKQREGSHVQKERGMIPAGSFVSISSIDMRKPIYLTWLVQGGWRLEKEMVLISDPMTETLPATFSLINQQSNRRLQISLEREFSNTNAYVKTVRIFVPYWIHNGAAIPLAYFIVEVEPVRRSDAETPWLLRAVKAAKHAASRPSHAIEARGSRISSIIQCLEQLEITRSTTIMLSPQAQLNRGGFMPFSPRAGEDGLLSPRLGISASALHSKVIRHGISFRELEDNERITMRAEDGNGAYYKLSVFLSMSSERTKVVNFQPHALYVNRIGRLVYVRQCGVDCAELLDANDPPKVVQWRSDREPELLTICIEGCNWSTPFSVESEGISHVTLESRENANVCTIIRVDIRSGTSGSRYLVIFRLVSFTSPYRIMNQSAVFPIRFRQIGCDSSSWKLLLPGSAMPFAWEDLQKEHKLEVMVDGAEPSRSRIVAIDECADYEPLESGSTPVAAFHIRIFREGSVQVVKVSDWTPSNQSLSLLPFNSSNMEQSQLAYKTKSANQHHMEHQIQISFNLFELGISLVDHTPEELLYVSVQDFSLLYATGLGSGISRLKLHINGLQIDNQLPFTPMPVLLRTQVAANPLDSIFKATLTTQDDGTVDRHRYPYIGIQCPNTVNAPVLINIHEPILWRLRQMFHQLNLGRLFMTQTTNFSIDPIITIGLLHTSEIRFKVSLAMSPSQRPQGALGFWASLMTALGNTDDLQIRIAQRVHEDIHMRKSSLLASSVSAIRKDVLSNPLLLLSGVDILGNASSALGHMSKSVAALSMDKKFIKSRQRQDTKASVEGFGEGFREGAEALGKGLFRGVTGIVTKPLEGARTSGMEGFVQGVGKGIIGVAAQPVSGVLDLLSKTTEGANAMKTKIAAVITSEGVALRHRLPRVIGADKVLRPYDEFKAQGQVLLQLAEAGSIFGPMDIFKVRGKFAATDAYEAHYNLPKGRTLIITNQRVILLQHPTSNILQRKPDVLKDPGLVLWDVTWKDISRLETAAGKNDIGRASRLNLYLYERVDSKESVRVIKCDPSSDQCDQVFAKIQQMMATYVPDTSHLGKKKNMHTPYSGPTHTMAPSTSSFEEAAGDAYLPPVPTFSSMLDNGG